MSTISTSPAVAGRDAAAVLRALYQVETASLISALHNAHPFVSRADARALSTLERIVADESTCRRRIAGALAQLDAMPPPPRGNPQVARYFYTALPHLLPALLADVRQRIAAYEHAATLVDEPGAARAIADNLGQHRGHEAALRELQAALGEAP